MKEDWQGQFGDEYTERNTPDVSVRYTFFNKVLRILPVWDITEVGCNKGVNLFALRALFPQAKLYGTEVNAKILKKGVGPFPVFEHLKDVPQTNLVFTCGVLIHVPSKELKEMMENIIKASSRYILAVEYFAPEETEVEYRGKKDMLWKRNYGKLYQDLGLTLLEEGDVPEIDNCHYWLLKK